jgi:hypothetical protein
VPALTLRPLPFPTFAVVRALPAVAFALAGGAGLALAVAALAAGGPVSVWVAVAGACACTGGLVVGLGGDPLVAAALAVLAAAAGVGALPAARDETPVAFADRAAPAEAKPHETTEAAPRHEAPRRATPRQIVRSYYAAIAAGDYARAWNRLTPGVQAALGGFDRWRRGYATTLSHRVEHVEVAPGGAVSLVLVAADRTPCGGTAEQRFAVTWRLVNGRAAELHAVRLSGKVPAAAC